jgi:membrane protease YdiL (CAAX protease family)
MTALLACLAVLGFYACFYRTVVKHWGVLVRPLVRRSGIEATSPLREIESMSKLAAAGVAQALFAAALMAGAGVDLSAVLGHGPPPELVALGVVLGVGELALASLLCAAVVEVALATTTPERRRDVQGRWLAESRGGWMAQFSATLQVGPAWFAVGCVGLYVAGEELVFRGILIELLRPQGAAVAIGASLALFTTAQGFHMPSLRAALFPVIGATVVGLVHGLVYWHAPGVLPLVVAHLTFFLGTLALVRTPAPVGAAG